MAEEKGEHIKPEEEKDHTRLFIGIGAVFTFLWIGFILVLYSETALPEEWSLNHLGDILAGSFAPLAVFWFALGFFLQMKEIRHQRIEIKKSTDELTNQTIQLKEQAKLTHKDIKLRLQEATPRLTFQLIETRKAPHNSSETDIYFYNNGGNALGVKGFSPLEGVKISIFDEQHNHVSHLTTGERGYIEVEHKIIDSNFSVELTYLDGFGNLYRHHCPFYPTEQEWPQFFEKPVEIKEPEEEE